MSTLVTISSIPAADLFTTGTTLAGKVKDLALGAGAAAIAWFLLKNLFKAGTFLAAGIAIAGAIVLWWLLGQSDNTSFQKPLTDTVNQNLGIGAPSAPSQDLIITVPGGGSA